MVDPSIREHYELSQNPIYLQWTQKTGWPSEAEGIEISRTIAIAGGVVTLALTSLLTVTGWTVIPLLIVVVGGVAFASLTPAAALMLTAQWVGKEVQQEQFALLRLTNVTDDQIASGYVAVIAHRLRWIPIIGWGLFVPVWIGLAFFGYSFNCLFGTCTSSLLLTAVMTLGFGLPLLLVLMPILIFVRWLYRTAIQGGILLGLRWKNDAVSVAAMIVMVMMISIVLLVSVSFLPVFPERLLIIAIPLMIAVLVVPGLLVTYLYPSWAQRALARLDME